MSDWFVDRARAAFVALFEMLAESVVALLAWLIRFIDTHTQPDLGAGWWQDMAGLAFGVAVSMMVAMFIVGVVEGLIAGRAGAVVRPVWVLFIAVTGAAVSPVVVDSLLGAVDWASAAVTSGAREDMTAGLTGLSMLLTGAGGGAAAGAAAAGASLSGPLLALGILAAGALLVLLLGAFVILKLREAAIYLVAVFWLFAFAGLLWHRAAPWWGRVARALFALVVCKLPIVLALAMGASALAGTFAGAGGQVLSSANSDEHVGVLLNVLATSVGMFALALASPLVVIRLFDAVGGQAAAAIGERVSLQRAKHVASSTSDRVQSLSAGSERLVGKVRQASWRTGGGASTAGAVGAAGAGVGVATWAAGMLDRARGVATSAADRAAGNGNGGPGRTEVGPRATPEPQPVAARQTVDTTPAQARATDRRPERDVAIRRITTAGHQAITAGDLNRAQELTVLARDVDEGRATPDIIPHRPEQVARLADDRIGARERARHGYTTVTAEVWPPPTTPDGRITPPTRRTPHE